MDTTVIKGRIKQNLNKIKNAGLEKRLANTNANSIAAISDRNKPDSDVIIAEATDKIAQAAMSGEYSIKLNGGTPLIADRIAKYFAKKNYIVVIDKPNNDVILCWLGSKKYRKNWFGKSDLVDAGSQKQLLDRIIKTITDSGIQSSELETVLEILGQLKDKGAKQQNVQSKTKADLAKNFKDLVFVNPKMTIGELNNYNKWKPTLDRL